MTASRCLATIFAIVAALASAPAPASAEPRLMAPAPVAAAPMSATDIDLNWSDVNLNVDRFIIERSTHPRRHFAPIATIEGGARSYHDGYLAPVTTYYYRVRARRGASLSRRSEVVGATTMPTAPVVPSPSVTVTPVPTQTPVATATIVAATATEVPVATATRTATPVPTATLTVTVTSTPIPTVTATRTANPTATATKTATATATATKTATPMPTTTPTVTATPDAVAPSAPSGVSAAAASCTDVTISWSAATDAGGSGLKGYDVYRNGTMIQQITAPATSTRDTGLAGGTVYTYLVIARDNAGNVSAASIGAIVNTPSCNRPPTANAGADQSASPGAAVTVNGSASTDVDGTIVSWSWSFGDGSSGTGAVAVHSYRDPGTYVATLTVTDDDGAQATDTATVRVTAATGGAHVRSQRFGGALVDQAYATAVDAAGNVVVTGEFSDRVSFGGATLSSAGATDVFIAKYGANGQSIWSKRLGGTLDDRGTGIAADPNGDVLVTGFIAGTVDFGMGPTTGGGGRDVFLAKYSGANGALVWVKRLGNTADDYGNGVAVDEAGNVIVVGQFASTVDFGGGALTSSYGSADIFIAKYSPNGDHLWSKRFGTSGIDIGQAVAVGPNGTIAMTGSFQAGVDFGTGVLRSTDASDDVFVAVYTADGQPLWAKRFGADFGDSGWGIAMDGDGNVVVAGTFRLTIDFGGGPMMSNGNTPGDAFLAKFGPTGAHLWSKHFGGISFDVARAVAVDGDGNVAVTGYYQGTADFGAGAVTSAGVADAFVAKFSSAGAPLWSHVYGSDSTDYGLSMAFDPTGNLVVAGAFSGSIDFGGGPLTSAGDRDVMVVTLAP